MARKDTGLIALEAATAEINTASVSIRTLRVNARQLTMGTFRQLVRRPLVDEERADLRGVVWGWVNYNPDGGPHDRQFVAQFGEELARCPTRIQRLTPGDDRDEDWPRPLRRLRGRVVDTCWAGALDGLARGDSPPRPVVNRYDILEAYLFGEWDVEPFSRLNIRADYDSSTGSLFAAIDRVVRPRQPTAWVDRAKVGDATRILDDDGRSTQVKVLERTPSEEAQAAKAALVTRIHGWGYPANRPREVWEEEMRRLGREGAEYLSRWNAMMERLAAAPQLFIAT